MAIDKRKDDCLENSLVLWRKKLIPIFKTDESEAKDYYYIDFLHIDEFQIFVNIGEDKDPVGKFYLGSMTFLPAY